jgi:hypothetical protein
MSVERRWGKSSSSTVAGRRVRRESAVSLEYTGHLGHRPVHLVIYDHERCQLAAQAHLLGTEGDAAIDLGGIVPTLAEALTLDLGGRRDQQDHQGVGMSLLDLTRPLEVDLEDQVAARRGIGERRAVEVSEEFCPFEESVGGDLLFEALAIDECVRVGRFTGTARARRPRAAEPEPGIGCD